MGYKLTFAYDNRGNLTDVVDRDNGTTHYVYDDDSRMTSVTNPFDETTGYVYSPGGRVEKRLLANGCVTYYGYDEVGQVSLVDNRAPDLSVISSFAYERDARGNPTRITREDGSVVEYGYDAKSQLTSEVHKDPLGATTDAWEWNYDLSGNRTYQIYNGVRTDYTYNMANQLTDETTAGVTTHYAYDRCGNMKSKQEPSGTTRYHWDPENRLTQIDQPGNAHSYFSYDADGKRVTKEDSEGFTRFIYQGPDMLKLLQERDEEGNVTAHYTIGDGLESMHRGEDSRFYHYDWLGSTFELTDGNGAVTDSYLYNAWGNALATSGATPNPHRYVGKLRYYEMPGMGLQNLGARWYGPTKGGFLSVDPFRRGGLRPYGYCEGGPTVRVDPSGLLDWQAFWEWYSVEEKSLDDAARRILAGRSDTSQTRSFIRRARDLIGDLVVYFGTRGWKYSAEGYQRYLNNTGGTMTSVPWQRVERLSSFLGAAWYDAMPGAAKAMVEGWAKSVECGRAVRIPALKWASTLYGPPVKYMYAHDVDLAILLGHYSVDFGPYSLPRPGDGDGRAGNMRWALRTYLDPAGSYFDFSNEDVPPLPIPLRKDERTKRGLSLLPERAYLSASIPRALEQLRAVTPFNIASEQLSWLYKDGLPCKRVGH